MRAWNLIFVGQHTTADYVLEHELIVVLIVVAHNDSSFAPLVYAMLANTDLLSFEL